MKIELKRLFDTLYYQQQNIPKKDALASKINGQWVPVSTDSFVEQVNQFSRGLLALGIEPGDKVALISNNRPEWCVADLGTLQIGAIDVPIYPTISESDYEYIFNHAEIKLCIVSDEELLRKVRAIEAKVPSMKGLYTFDQIEGATHWSEILEKGKDGDQSKVQELMDGVKSEDLATIIYTSGTTGTPKGVMLSHWNILSNSIDSTKRLPVEEGDLRSLSFLPVCHVYERMLIYLYIINGVSIYFAESMETIGDNLREVKPQVFTAVPRLLEKVYDRIMEKGEALTGIKRSLFFWAVRLAERWEPFGANGAWYEFQLSIARKIIFSKWQEGVGGRTQAVASGSAALQPRLARIFNAAGIPVMEGYGLTETSPVIAVNEPANRGLMIGTVGRVIDNVEVRIAEDGEILAKGPNVMMGYYKDPDRTREVLTEDGWFHTGDIGQMVGPNKDFLKITDRKKEIFKTSGGKYVAPQPIENMIKASSYIEQVMVVGEGKKHPAVLVVPAFEALEVWCKRQSIDTYDNDKMLGEKRVHDLLWEEVQRLTADLGHWEQPKKMEVCSAPWGVDTGELTPTLKLRRKVILQKYQEMVDRIYA
ncbi:MAG: long-chain fatty acid--CoA ligase [Leptolyngbya sp. SIO3F4]|nr:long-chain fatty acid--CoA ligase [Leptolyngbya sp. SIO3F4]